ncbi:MAG: hypothetical protein Q9196_001289 [Gyalolechia fulgens]
METIRIGATRLTKDQSLLLMAGTSIHCSNRLDIIVEFPELSRCGDQHEYNYRDYVERLGVPDAPYLTTLRDDDPPIGLLHKSIAILGGGSFGVVHKAIHVRTGTLYAIKLLSRREQHSSMDQLKEPNIIQYHEAFEVKGQICIKMELAANDLPKHLDARRPNTRKPFLSLQCVRSVGRQALSAIEYLHKQGVTHRDLKPENILVTKWDPRTDIPTIKLADFGLASPNKEWLKILERDKEASTETRNIPPIQYGRSVDIWALGKILKLLLDSVPPSTVVRGKLMRINTGPAVRLIGKMMQEIPTERPTAWQCLQDPWMVSDDYYDLPITKRDRSPTPGQCPAHPFKKVHLTPSGPVIDTKEGSTMLLSTLWPNRQEHYSMSYNKRSREITIRLNSKEILNSLVDQPNVPVESMEIDSLVIKPDAEEQWTISAQNRDETMMNDNAAVPVLFEPHDTSPNLSPSMRMVVGKLIAALKYRKKEEEEAIRKGVSELHITKAQVQYGAESRVGGEIGDAENPQYDPCLPAITISGEDISDAKVHQAAYLHDGELGMDHVKNSPGSTWSWSSENSQPVTYPSDDVMAGLSFILPRSLG